MVALFVSKGITSVHLTCSISLLQQRFACYNITKGYNYWLFESREGEDDPSPNNCLNSSLCLLLQLSIDISFCPSSVDRLKKK